MQLIKILNTI